MNGCTESHWSPPNQSLAISSKLMARRDDLPCVRGIFRLPTRGPLCFCIIDIIWSILVARHQIDDDDDKDDDLRRPRLITGVINEILGRRERTLWNYDYQNGSICSASRRYVVGCAKCVNDKSIPKLATGIVVCATVKPGPRTWDVLPQCSVSSSTLYYDHCLAW